MKLTTIFLAGLGVFWGYALVDAAPPSVRPVYTNKTRFRIPYRYDAAEMQKLGAREIRLYVSVDRGISWHHAQTVSPETGKFEFQANGDGEYWFAVRTIDRAMQLHPPGNITEPELKVTVDTAPPALEITLRQLDASRVQLSWNAVDANLDPRQLRLEYIQTGESNWQKVSIVPQPSGQTAWSAPQGGYVAVRGTISDLASNAGNAQNQIRIETGASLPRPSVPDLSQPIANAPTDELASANTPQPPKVAEPAVSGTPSMPIPGAMPGQFVADDPGRRPDILSGRYSENSPPTPPAASDIPSRVVNARRFQIGYQVEDVGPSGISTVELFITENDGRTWFKYGDDTDRTTPFEVQVPRDGIFGFDLRVKSGAGISAPPPQPGDRPSMIVVVDSTPPTAQLLPVEQGQGASLNKVLVRWKSRDDYPNDQPILLSYASSPAGPWEPITGWLPNTGSHLWTVSQGIPARCYVRLTARDAAGNVTTAETPEPVVVDFARPSARIVDVETGAVPTERY